MKCKYCGYELSESAVFCDNCGQQVVLSIRDEKSEQFWSRGEKNNVNLNEDYAKNKAAEKKRGRQIKAKKSITVFSVVIIVVSIISIVIGLINNSENNMVELKENLPGSKLETYYSKTQPPLFSNIYYYHALKFNDDGTLDYYYVSTGGPREDDEPLEYVDTYTYSLSKKFLGDYVIQFSDMEFRLGVVNGCEPDWITCESK